MAGLQQSLPASNNLSTPPTRVPSPTRSLPNGSCTYRDLTSGACGCNQFWDKTSAEIHDSSNEKLPTNERSTWCVCTHHACFHTALPSTVGTDSRALPACDVRCQCKPGLQCNVHNRRSAMDPCPPVGGSQGSCNEQLKISQPLLSLGLLPPAFTQSVEAAQVHGLRDAPSHPSTSDLPRVPSVCFLSHDRRSTPQNEGRQVRHEADQSLQHGTGLGLSLVNCGNIEKPIDPQQSISSTVPDDVVPPNESYSEPELPPTRANSMPEDIVKASDPQGSIEQVYEFNRTLHVNISGDTVPNTYNPEEFLQSATEVATPSNANTPNLGAADQAVHDTKKLFETLSRLTSAVEHPTGSETRPSSAASARIPPLLLANSPVIPQDQIKQAIRSASPQAFQKLVSYLNPLHNLLNSIPNVATAIREINNRLDLIESHSFNQVAPEDLDQRFDQHDGRLLEIEHRMNEHDRLHQAIDADQSSNSFGRRQNAINESLGANNSVHSTTSSALVVAAMGRKGIDEEFEGIKDRLDVLEAAALPTTTNPWQVEVVMLPWGPELPGIWFGRDEPMHDTAKATTQDSEDWTQVRGIIATQATQAAHAAHAAPSFDSNTSSARNSSHPSDGGWSSQAISDWVTEAEEGLLSPKACGSNNMVYKRLQSRGFVRDVELTSANSRDIQGTLANAFGDMMEQLKHANDSQDPLITSYPGLRAAFIPLRKVAKESRLRFLNTAEMMSSAVWSAQFLSSGVMMRVSGGKKRLYVTQPQAYLQHKDVNEDEQLWTWQRLRELPRFQSDPDSQMEGNEEQCQPQVAEADAREACWAFVEAYDQPPLSVHSSFGSNQSVELSMRPADRQWRRSMTPSSILKHRIPQPISPLSENHPHRPSHGRPRTVSISYIEQHHSGSSKRRLNSSPAKHPSKAHATARNPSVSISKSKRRRVTRAASPQEAQGAAGPTWNPTPRRSREPPSPFFSSHPELPRTNSDAASRSQRSVAVVGKTTPFAYATPHSGPFVGRPDVDEFQGGDTEPDDNDVDEHDDDEQSWRGVDDQTNESADPVADDGQVDEDGSSFFAEHSGFGSDDDDEDEDSENFDFGARRDGPGDEDGDDVFDTLLGVLQ
ncbi:hypothetical protein EJ04DRAFT_457492 [Polyplosphaeria fusca]|uniref:Uncharacterized protein n=1 Tax=Polyplosphaeria fusca TaxID=682080 RepID=A0A9P4R9V6_9PLEO|nr:hypothetical protein EJ04DRAFT_457492 [Polyplosphaeria fusca]